jgi:hypothetical protein
MPEESALLDEFIAVKTQKGRIFNSLSATLVLFIAIAIIDFSIDLKTFSFKHFKWQIALIFLSLPILGLLFHVLSKKIGWIINCFYYLFVSTATCFDFVRKSITSNNRELMNWQEILVLLFGIIVLGILWSKPIRKYFQITTALFFSVCGITLGLVIAMFSVLE